MRRLVLLAVLGGCGFRLNSVGSNRGDGGADGSRDGVIDVPPGVSDVDGDGIPDTLDNCPMMPNADQRDHDSDGRGDVCDLCPHIPETTDTDTDGDGVGDACDPRPMMAGDHRALWVGFYDAADISGWTQGGGSTWAVTGGMLTGGDVNTSLAYIYPPAFQRAFAQTLVRVNTLASPTGSVTPGAVLFTGDIGAGQFYECEVASTNNSGLVLYTRDQLAFDPKTWSGTFTTNSQIMLTDSVIAGQHTCTASQGATLLTTTQSAGLTMGATLPAAAYANLSFDYLFVVEVGN